MTQKSLSIALQMDDIATINIAKDTTFVMGLNAQERGHTLWYYHPSSLSYANGTATAIAQPLTLRNEQGNHYTLGDPTTLDLGRDTDVVLMRQDPPFDMAYVTYTHILDLVHGVGKNKTLVVNNPTWVRNSPEKLLIMQFPQFIPPTIISRNPEQIAQFRDEHQDIIIKPLFGCGGAGVFHLKPNDSNLNSLLEMFFAQSPEPIMVQRYEPAVKNGDKRILLLDGEPIGAFSRVPQTGESRANLFAGGTAQKCEITPHEQKICDTIGGYLRDNGLIFVGIDIIGDIMTEINVTSPMGIQQINTFNQTKLESQFWDCIESKLA